MKFALSSAFFSLYNVRDGVALGPKQLEMLKAAGIDRIEVWLEPTAPFGPAHHCHVHYDDPAEIARVVNSARALGVEIYSIHAPWNFCYTRQEFLSMIQGDGIDPVTAMRLADEENIDKWDLTHPQNHAGIEAVRGLVDITAMMGAQMVVAHIYKIQNTSQEERENLYENLSAVLPYFEERGIQLAIENIFPIGIDIVKSLPSKNVGIVLCTHHTLTSVGHPGYMIYPPTEPLVEAIHACGDRLIHLHLSEVFSAEVCDWQAISHYEHGRDKEAILKNGGMAVHFIPYDFDSGLDWPALLKALQDVAFDGVYLFEPDAILPDYQEEKLAFVKAGFERMAQEGSPRET